MLTNPAADTFCSRDFLRQDTFLAFLANLKANYCTRTQIHANTHEHTYAHAHAHANTHTHICIHTATHTHVTTNSCLHTHKCKHTLAHANRQSGQSVDIHTKIHHIHTFIHTCMHTCIRAYIHENKSYPHAAAWIALCCTHTYNKKKVKHVLCTLSPPS